jgi:hypothetical protein
VSLGACSFDFRNPDASITTLRGNVSADILLQGQVDETDGSGTPVAKTTVRGVSIDTLRVIAGPAPKVPTPIPTSDEVKLQQLAVTLIDRFERGGFEPDGGTFSRCDEANAGDNLPAGTRHFCSTYLADDRFNGELEIAFAVDQDQVVGIRSVDFGGNF